MTLSLVLGILVGIVMGLTGAGGGILAVPALMLSFGWTPQQAAPVALLAATLGASVGAFEGLRRSQVRYRAAFLIAAASLPFSSLGLRLAKVLPTVTLLWTFTAVLVFVAVRLIRQSHSYETILFPAHTPGHLDRDSGRFEWNWPTAALFATVGGVAGLMSGLLGVGGGFVVVPLLRRFTDAALHTLIATSLLIVALVSLGSLTTAVIHGAILPPTITAAFAASLIGGMLIGRHMVHKLRSEQVQTGFAILLLLVACGMALKAAAI